MKIFFTEPLTNFIFSVAVLGFSLLFIPTSVLGAEASLIKDIKEGADGSTFDAGDILGTIGSTVYFTADDGVHGKELWKSNGTATGTVLVKDIKTGSDSGFAPTQIEGVVFNNNLYFRANDGSGTALWKSDGTEAGTVSVKAFPQGAGTFLVVGSTLYLWGDDNVSGGELWKSDGTEAGTVLVKDIYVGSQSSGVQYFIALGSTIYFMANDGIGGYELWKSDGTEAGTVLVKDINSGVAHSYPIPLAVIGSTLFFEANDGVNGAELWKSDGTEAGTVLVKDIRPGSSGSYINGEEEVVVMGGNLYFGADANVSARELWKSDGTEAGTVLIKTSQCDIENLFLLGSLIYFTACRDGSVGEELWKSDGTTDGTVMIKDIASGGSDSDVNNLIAIGSTLYFGAYTSEIGQELWKSDGTEAGTLNVVDINPGSGSSDPVGPVVLGDRLFIFAYTPTYGEEPYIITFADEEPEPEPEPEPRRSSGGGGGKRKPKVIAPVVVTTPTTTAPVTTPPGGSVKLNPAVYDLIVKNKSVFEAARKMGIQLPQFILDILKTPVNTTTVNQAPKPYVRDLELGAQGEDVRKLKMLLIQQKAGPRAVILGRSTPDGFFGAITKDALIEYQIANGIVPASGYFGPLTRAQMKRKGLSALWW